MCGICGIYGQRDELKLKEMLSVLRHRGPDDEGVFFDENVSLGHRRLSIIDLSEKGRQPMSNEEKDIWLVVNGEIYNFQYLRQELIKKGHIFCSQSDSEVIIHAYEEYGLDFFKKINGMFAIALYDKRNNIFILARDFLGEKPLYYYFEKEKIYFASEIKAILKAGIKKEIEKEALYNYLSFQYTVGEKTLFAGIKKLLPGHMLILRDGKLEIKRYWDIPEEIIKIDEVETIHKLRNILEDSVRVRMIADVPIGAFLSGGIDSSAVVALAKAYIKKFHTFSVGFESHSELKYAKIVSQFLNTIHHEIIVTADMVAQDIFEITWHNDEPLGDAAIINNYYLSKEAKKYVKVVLAGEGGDEVFGGYPNYLRNLKYNFIFKTPLFLRKIFFLPFQLLKKGENPNSIFNKIYRHANFLIQLSFRDAHIYTTKTLKDFEINCLSKNSLSKKKDSYVYFLEMNDNFNKMLYIDCKNLLPERYLMKADKATMANSIEERLPLLDKNLVEFVFRLPFKFKIKNKQEKYILRRAVEGLLPAEIVNRPKAGFGTPLKYWLKQESIKKIVIDKLKNGKLVKELFDIIKIKKLLENLDRNNNSQIIWTIFALQIWHEVYFES